MDRPGRNVVYWILSERDRRPTAWRIRPVLREAGVARTRIFCYLDPQDSEIENMARLFADIQRIMRNAPDRSGED